MSPPRRFFPFVCGTSSRGEKKHELDADRYEVRELDIGVEGRPLAAFAWVAQYVVARRRFEDAAHPANEHKDRLLRVPAPFVPLVSEALVEIERRACASAPAIRSRQPSANASIA